MKNNMGLADKRMRILIAIVIGVLYFTADTISGILAIISGIVATLLVLTSFISFCAPYLPFGINTSKKSNR